MYRMACKDPKIESSCRRLSCVYPGICENLGTDHAPLISVYQKARALPGIKKILISSGLRYDLAVRSPEYVKELVTHHVGGYLKIAPEHTQDGPLSKMMKPGIGAYERFKQMFDKFSREAGKEQYLIPYFIAAHPGTTDEDMLELALWLKKNGFRLDQVQTFLPTPLAIATAMWHTEKKPAAQSHDGFRRRCRGAWRTPAQTAQGLPALSRSRELAPVARSAESHGPQRPHRAGQAPPDPGLAAGWDGQPDEAAPTGTRRRGAHTKVGAGTTASNLRRARHTRQDTVGTPSSGRATPSAVAPQGRLGADRTQNTGGNFRG
jgi:hypothetical protein